MANLTFAEDFSNITLLDSGLIGVPESGINWNRGVHPIVTVDNLLSFLPITDITFTDYSSLVTYGNYELTGLKSDIVSSDDNLYISKVAGNLGNPVSDTTYWQLTNIESIRIRNFISNSKQNMFSAMSISRKLIENQYIYNVGEDLVTLSGNYSGWVFEPKNSDYVKIRINQMSLQANTSNPVNIYVINQERLITTLVLNPADGVLEFEDVGYVITGKGQFKFVFESQEVKSGSVFNDVLKYSGFVCYPITGDGSTAASASYVNSNVSNGLNFNVTAYLDSTQYITNNLIDFSKLLQLQFSMDVLQLMQHNSNSRSTREQRMLTDEQNANLLAIQTLNLDSHTVAKMYLSELKNAKNAINRTFDKFLQAPTNFKVKVSVI